MRRPGYPGAVEGNYRRSDSTADVDWFACARAARPLWLRIENRVRFADSSAMFASRMRLSAALLLTIPGVGLLTTAWLLVATLNFTLCPTPEAAAAYAGLVPRPFQSGSSVYKRPTIGQTGHARLRRALYLAALSATRWNPLIRPFYQRLRAAGKPHKVACCAAARKLLHLAWAVVTKQQPFCAERATPPPS